jgi:hypothetical protein
VLAAEHFLDLGALDLGFEIVEAAREIGGDVLARFCPLDEDCQIVAPPSQGRRQGDFLFEAAPALEHLLRFGLILPEVRLRGARLERAQLVGRSSGLKDNSACLTSVS